MTEVAMTWRITSVDLSMVGVFGGILFVPKLRLVWILWCKFGVVLCHKCLRQRFLTADDVEIFIVVFTTSSVSAKTIASMDLSPNSPKTHQNVKHPYLIVYSRKYYQRLGCMG
jgi:hypothetical protein